MEYEEKLKLDYEQTTHYHHELHNVRFRLLALVPIVTGVAVGFLSDATSGSKVLTIGILGFLVTLGIAIYDQRNTQIYDSMQKRAKTLEAKLGFDPIDKNIRKRGGAFLDRPHRSRKLFGLFLMWHDRALAIIYSAVFAAWSYLIVDGFIKILGHDLWNILLWCRVLIPIMIFFLFLLELHRFDEPTDVPEALSQETRKDIFIE